MAIFYAAIPVGSALGYVLGGQVTAWAHGDWRWAFFIVVPPGLLLGVWCFLMRDPPRGAADGAVMHKASWADYLAMIKTPSYLLTTLGMTAMTFAMGGMAFWMPRYGVERQAPSVLTAEDQTKILNRYGPSDASPDQRDAILEQHAVDYLRTGGESNDPGEREQIRKKLTDLRNQVNLTFGIIVVVSGLGGTILGGIAGIGSSRGCPGLIFWSPRWRWPPPFR